MSITVSIGESHTSKAMKRVTVPSMAGLAKLMQRHPSTMKGGAHITPGWMEGGKRSAENVRPARIIQLDCDALTPNKAHSVKAAAANYSAIVYETRKSTADDPRLRIIVECDRDIDHADYKTAHDQLVAEISKAAGVTLQADPSCANSAQCLFTPLKGRAVTVHKGRKFTPPSNVVSVDFSGLIRLDGEQRNVNLTRLAGSLRVKGLNEKQIFAAIRGVSATMPNPLPDRELKAIARSIAKKPAGESAGGAVIVLRTAVDIVENPVAANWLLKPYLEQDVLAVMAGEYGTFKSFLSLDWSLHTAGGRVWHGDPRRKIDAQPVVFISAEGRGLAKRVRAWVVRHYPNEPVEAVLKRLKFYAVEMAIDLSDTDRMTALVSAIDALGITPALIVVDTLTKNSTGVEENNSAMQSFLNAVNNSLRMRYRCTVLMIHHVGHAVKDRARGPSSLVANTDASFLVERMDDRNIVLRTDRLKDSEVPEPLALHATVIDLGHDENGDPVSSLVLDHVGEFDVRLIPTGENQRKVWDALCASGTTSFTKTTLWQLGRTVIARERVPEAMAGLRKSGWLVVRDGRWEFTR